MASTAELAEAIRKVAWEYWHWEAKMRMLPREKRASWHGDRFEDWLENALDLAGHEDTRAIREDAEREAARWVKDHGVNSSCSIRIPSDQGA